MGAMTNPSPCDAGAGSSSPVPENTDAARRVLVCGGTGAIGRALVSALAEAGHHVAFSGRDGGRGAALAEATGADFITHTEELEGAPVITAAAQRLGGLDGVVLNAGTVEHARLGETSPDRLREILNVNVTVPVRQAQTAAELMSSGGSIVAVASNAGLWAETEVGAYSVSKAALLAACRALAVQFSARGVRVNAVCPGDTEPGMAATIGLGEEFSMLPPLARLGQPADTTAAVSFLLSPQAGFITGAHLLVDGGMHAALDAGRSR